jgi:uncharacterized membrane protein YeaQ/YmgE (transglycosylase-associated protein family)
MSLLAWIVLGLVAGFIASKAVDDTGQGLLFDILLGVVEAVVGGFLFNQFGEPGVAGLNLHSLLVAVVGAFLVLRLHHAVVEPQSGVLTGRVRGAVAQCQTLGRLRCRS